MQRAREFFQAQTQVECFDKMRARLHDLEGQVQVEEVKRQTIGRNDTCPCGSGIKFKKCCIDKAI